ncbi:MAG: hypothetical protein KIT79_14355 [Deltaproteobacteria bacterium]|nr:hypothetical protein [Deltaproteobacteria bacterium]
MRRATIFRLSGPAPLLVLAAILASGSGAAAQELGVSRIESCQPLADKRVQCSVVASKVNCASRRFTDPHQDAPPLTLPEKTARQQKGRWKLGQLNIPSQCEPFIVEEMSEGILAVFIDTAKLGADGYVETGGAPAGQTAAAAPIAPVSSAAIVGPEGAASPKPIGEQVEQASGIPLLAGDFVRVRQPRPAGSRDESDYAYVSVRDGYPVWHVRGAATLAMNRPLNGLPHTVWLLVHAGAEPHDRIEAELVRSGVTVARWAMNRVWTNGPEWIRLERELPAGTLEPAMNPGDDLRFRIIDQNEARELDIVKAKLVQAR